ncbi:MAG: hypothetical protein ACLSDQ_12010 [Adlercreutzia equolifaciens]
MFGALIICSLLAGIVGLIVRRKNFGATDAADDDIESMMSKEAAYYVNNLIMIVFAVLLAYMTVSSALPSWLPFGGQSCRPAPTTPSPGPWASPIWPCSPSARFWAGAAPTRRRSGEVPACRRCARSCCSSCS